MTPYFSDEWLTTYLGDNRAVMSEMPAESVHCVITSPPYWGLRDYGTATWDGGDTDCDHRIGRTMGNANKGAVREVMDGNRSECKCGARRIDAQLGLERTPEEYVANLVAVFREVRRVLRADGTVWLNLGDSYAAGPTGSLGDKITLGGGQANQAANLSRPSKLVPGLKPKDLVGIPWRVAFALQADGWYLRSDIIWAKPNPMPESVTDRPTKSHEYLFLLSRSPRYYFDAGAVKEPQSDWSFARGSVAANEAGVGKASSRGLARGIEPNPAGRNIRSVWTIATQPYRGAHFATFPKKLVEPCVKAGCPEGGVVLDPFGGSGTVAVVAQSLGRRSVLIDLNPDYMQMQLERNSVATLGMSG